MTRQPPVSAAELRREYRGSSKSEEDRHEIWTFYFARPIAFHCAAALLRVGTTANQATWLSLVVLLAGSLLLGFGSHGAALLGAGLLNAWLVLDCADGTIARYRRSQSAYGAYLDALSGYAAYALVFLASGLGAYNRPDDLWLFDPSAAGGAADRGTWMLLGAWTSIAALWSRLAYQKFKNTFEAVGLRRHDLIDAASGRSSSRRLLGMGNDLLNLSGVLLPVLFLAVLLGALHLFLLFAAIGNTALLIVTQGWLLRRAARVGSPGVSGDDG